MCAIGGAKLGRVVSFYCPEQGGAVGLVQANLNSPRDIVEPSDIGAFRVADAAAKVVATKRLDVAVEKDQIGSFVMSGIDGVFVSGGNGCRITRATIGQEGYVGGSAELLESVGLGFDPGGEVDIHTI